MITPRELTDCTALITGSSAGIGLEIAAQLAEAGVPRIVLNGRDEARCAAAAEKLRARAPNADVRYAVGDTSVSGGAQAVADAALAAFGAVDILVNSVPGPKEHTPQPFQRTEYAELDAQVYAHMMSVVYACRAVMPAMIERKGGVIINIASDAGKIATPGEAIIGGSKAGVIMFTRGLALEQSREGIRANVITPSIVAGTEGYDRVMSQEFSRKLFQKAESRAKLGVVTPADIAPLAVFLASPAASKITGQAISVNGGISAA